MMTNDLGREIGHRLSIIVNLMPFFRNILATIDNVSSIKESSPVLNFDRDACKRAGLGFIPNRKK